MQSASLALQMGRSLQKQQTGFVHYCAESKDGISHDTIPIYENSLFALALFRSRLSDHVLEAKHLIERILAFEKEGDFPTYVHEYPNIANPYLSLHLLPIFFWILHDFSHVIGELKEKLVRMVQQMQLRMKQRNLPAWGQFRMNGFEGKIGPCPTNVFEWGQACISLQIAQKNGAEIESFLMKACQCWHPALSVYVGPYRQRLQEGIFPELTLFDLFMCEWQKHYPERGKLLRPIHLLGALIRPQEIVFDHKPALFVHFQVQEEWPLWICWGEGHTFAMPRRQMKVTGTLEKLWIEPDGEEELGIQLFLNYHPDHQITVNGRKATSFQAGDEVRIDSRGFTLRFSFACEDGTYFGHIFRGNRPGQISCKGKNAFASYDWKIALRTVQAGKKLIQMRVLLEMPKQENQQRFPLHADHYPHIKLPQ